MRGDLSPLRSVRGDLSPLRSAVIASFAELLRLGAGELRGVALFLVCEEGGGGLIEKKKDGDLYVCVKSREGAGRYLCKKVNCAEPNLAVIIFSNND